MLTADQLIDAYAADVARLLPRKQRGDVAMELRALLHDEIDAAAPDSDRRDEAAREYLTGLGRPADVAARYGPPVTLIDPSDTRWFLTPAGSGSLIIVIAGLLSILSGQPGGGDFAERLWTRNAELISSVATCVVLAWAPPAPIFRSGPTDEAMRGWMSMIILVSLIGLGQQLRRRRV